MQLSDIEKATAIYSVSHSLRNRIDRSNLLQKRIKEKWDHVEHHRVANHMRLYTAVVNVNKFMLVAHRNMISVYDMTKDIYQTSMAGF